jgi:hypothetical protein
MPSGLTANKGAVYAVAGSSGQISGGTLNHPAMFVSLNVLGSVVLDISANRLNLSFVNSSGTVQDYFTMIKGDVPTVAGRKVFYNNSAWDGNNPLANVNDDAAIATDKTALLPGGTATFANYTSYSLGINGIMVDISALGGTPTVNDFVFKSGNDNNPADWSSAPPPSSITVRTGAGVGGSDRLTIIWADHAIQGKWLQVTVLAGAATGLITDDVFFFGNAVGDSGNSAANAQVDLADEIVARNNPRTVFNPATLDNACDYNRDKRVDLADEILARNNGTTFFSALKLIAVSSAAFAPSSLTHAAVETSQALTIQQRGTAIWIMYHGPAEITPVLTTTTDLAQDIWTSVNTPPTYASGDSSWTWRLDTSGQSAQAFYRLAGTPGN